MEEKTQELYADLDTLDASVHRKISESQAEMSRKVDKDVSTKLKMMDQQLKVSHQPVLSHSARCETRCGNSSMHGLCTPPAQVATEAKSIAQQTRSNLQMRFEMLEMGEQTTIIPGLQMHTGTNIYSVAHLPTIAG